MWSGQKRSSRMVHQSERGTKVNHNYKPHTTVGKRVVKDWQNIEVWGQAPKVWEDGRETMTERMWECKKSHVDCEWLLCIYILLCEALKSVTFPVVVAGIVTNIGDELWKVKLSTRGLLLQRRKWSKHQKISLLLRICNLIPCCHIWWIKWGSIGTSST